ncbi:MAG: hypothetical protein JSV97_13385 [candidate division WOR-3 bacterium]|nr:MAG: hypothetical protein JSV97_13385 [candidate division WOR-3 bacterium]
MHNKLLCLTVALLFIGSVTFAEGPEVTHHGTFYIYSFFWQNADFDADLPTEDISDGDQFFYMHADIGVLVDFGQGVSSKVTIGGWGTFGKHPITYEGIEGGTEGQNAGVREAYIHFANIFDTPISFKAGKMWVLYGDQVFDGGEDGAMGAKFLVNTDMVDFDLAWYRLVEGGGCRCVGLDPGPIDDDLDLFAGWLTLKLMEGAVNLAPYGFYRTRSFYVDGVTITDAPMWVGGRLDATPIPGLSFAGEFTMMMGSYTEDEDYELDYAGMHYMGRLSYMPPGIPISFGGAYMSFSGDDGETDDEWELYESPIWGPYTFNFYKWWPGLGTVHTLRSAFGFAMMMPPYVAGVTDEDIFVVNLNVINGHLAFHQGPLMLRGDVFMYSKHWVPDGDESDMGMEFDLLATYTYRKTITVGATVGYWTPGDYFGEDLDPMLGGYLFTFITF